PMGGREGESAYRISVRVEGVKSEPVHLFDARQLLPGDALRAPKGPLQREAAAVRAAHGRERRRQSAQVSRHPAILAADACPSAYCAGTAGRGDAPTR